MGENRLLTGKPLNAGFQSGEVLNFFGAVFHCKWWGIITVGYV